MTKISEVKQKLDAFLELYGDVEVCIDPLSDYNYAGDDGRVDVCASSTDDGKTWKVSIF